MVALAVFVQLLVYGATKIRMSHAPLEHWQPVFGWAYGMAFVAFQVGFCRAIGRTKGYWWICCTWVGYLLVVVVAEATATRSRFTFNAFWALGSGLSAMVLFAAFHTNRLRTKKEEKASRIRWY
jgi:hypothetical protein